MNRKRLSVVIPTFNVEAILGRCLDALTWADEVVVVDMFSADRTQEIATSYPNVRFLQSHGYIYARVNQGMEAATGDWIMRLDSDEVVSPELAQEIQDRVLSPEGWANNAYVVPSRVFFFGRWIRHAVVNDPRRLRTGYSYRLILFKKGLARYEVRHEHEDLQVQGPVGWLTQPYDHYTFTSIEQWIAKQNYYTSCDAERIDPKTVEINLRSILKVATSPLVGFVKLYFLQGGYRDGIWGLILALLGCNYYLWEQLKQWERKLNLDP